jgi:hypothetical protein
MLCCKRKIREALRSDQLLNQKTVLHVEACKRRDSVLELMKPHKARLAEIEAEIDALESDIDYRTEQLIDREDELAKRKRAAELEEELQAERVKKLAEEDAIRIAQDKLVNGIL